MLVNPDDIKQAMIRGKYDICYLTVQSFIQDLYNLVPESDTTPLLAVRILEFLNSAWQSNSDNDGRYVPVREILGYFENMDIEGRITEAQLDAMLRRGLCLRAYPRNSPDA